ncbi:MAG: transposase [Flavobacteriales bacterium Tduv]
MVKESLSYMLFFGFRFENQNPNHRTLCRFCNEIVDKKTYDRLLKKINKQLGKHQAIVKTGVIVDTSITVRPFAPKGPPTYVVEDREGRGQNQISQRKSRTKKETQSGVNPQGKWLKKSGKLYYGYKKT